MYNIQENIIALSTPSGVAALAVVRISGKDSVAIFNTYFSKNIAEAKGYTMHYGYINNANNEPIDEVIASVFRAPNSFTGEDMVEISCHGSPIVVQLIIQLMLNTKKIKPAAAGEFSLRAYLNGKVDLVKAESIADLIHSETEAAHKVAINQLRNGFSSKLQLLKKELIDLAALLELELDFGEEDVEFAKRDRLHDLCRAIIEELEYLKGSFKYGNALKNGVQTVIAGKPNAGKSTLLNALLNDERAIVSEIAGTTRDTLEEKLVIDGVLFNLIDTAGLRDQTDDKIEQIGIERARKAISKANLTLYLIDASNKKSEIESEIDATKLLESNTIIVFTKSDRTTANDLMLLKNHPDSIAISAEKNQLQELLEKLQEMAKKLNAHGSSTLVSNQRHLFALQQAHDSLESVINGLTEGNYIEQLASDLKLALLHLGEITGETITADDVLSSVFSNFCIGK